MQQRTNQPDAFFVNAQNNVFLQFSGNLGCNKTVDRGKSYSIWGPLQLVNVEKFKNGSPCIICFRDGNGFRIFLKWLKLRLK